MYGGPRSNRYTFESSDPWLARRFYDILILSFRIEPEEYQIVQPWVGYSYFVFWTSEETKHRIEYSFRRLLKFDKLYLLDRSYNKIKYGRDGYAIY